MNEAGDRRKAGMFLLSALALLALLVGTLLGVRLLAREKIYLVEFRESVAGLEISSVVKYKGVPVGQVQEIRFHPEDPGRIRVRIGVRPDAPVKMDTRAQLRPQGITGISFLELSGGTAKSDDMPEGDIIPTDASFGEAIGGIARNMAELLERLNLFFAKNEADLTASIKDFRAIMEGVRKGLDRLDALADKGEAALDEARAAAAQVREETREAGEALRRIADRTETLLADPALDRLGGKAEAVLDEAREALAGADVRALVEEARAAIAEFRVIEESLDRAARAMASLTEAGREDAAAALADLRRAAEHVKEASRRLKEDPSRLLKSPPPSEKGFPDPLPAGGDRP